MNERARRSDQQETPAEVFDRLFLPAMAGPWAVRLVDAAGLTPGSRVLDVACGTGAVAQEALRRVGPDGQVTGLDLSPEMLAVARRKLPHLDLQEGRAEKLPFADDAFDAVTCQLGLMFFDEPLTALLEMRRVLRRGGAVAVAVWDSLDRSPGYEALTHTVEKHLGVEAGLPIRASFALGDVDLMGGLLEEAGFGAVRAESVQAEARFPSVSDWVEAEVKGWVGGDFGDREYAALLQDAEDALAAHRRVDGRVEFVLPAIIATGTKDERVSS